MIWGKLFAVGLVFLFGLNSWAFFGQKGMLPALLMMTGASLGGAAFGFFARFILDILRGV